MLKTHRVHHALRSAVVLSISTLAALVLILPIPAAAQTPTLVTGQAKDVNGLPYSFAKVSASLVGIPPNVNATIIVNGIPTAIGGQQNGSADANGNFTMNLFCNTAGGGCSVISPSGTSWQFTINENGLPPPLGTGPQTCSAALSITGATQSISASFASCPALGNLNGNIVTSTQNFIDPTAPPFNVFPDVNFIGNDGVTVNGANTLTSATLNCNTANNGKLVIVVKPSNGNYPFGTGLVTQTGCSSSTVATLSANAGADAGSGQTWAIGTDWGAQFNAAATAAWNSTKGLLAPCGGVIVATPPFVTAANPPSWSQATSISGCLNVPGSQFIIHPNITNGLAANATIFYKAVSPPVGFIPTGGTDYDVNNIRVTSLGGNIPTQAAQTFLTAPAASLRMHGIQAHALGCTNPSTIVFSSPAGEGFYDLMNVQTITGCTAFFLTGQGQNEISNSILAFGSGVMVNCGSSSMCSMVNDYYTQNLPMTLSGTASQLDIVGGFYLTTGQAVATIGGTNNVVTVSGGPNMTILNNPTTGIFNETSASAKLYLNGGIFTGTGTTASFVFGSGQVFDGSVNQFNLINGGSLVSGPTLFGSASVTGTTQTAGNFADGTGLGTSTFGSVSGDSRHGQVTITYAGALATPATWTMTFPTTFFAVPSCTVTGNGGTNAFPTQIDTINTAPTVTTLTVKMTFAAAPTAANTNTFVWNCSN